MRLQFTVAVTASLLSALIGPQFASAGDCPGMDHYTYDRGECTDKSGDMFEVLEKSYDEGYRQNLTIMQRDRASGVAAGGGRGLARGGGFNGVEMARDMTALVTFVPRPESPGVAALVADARPAGRAEMARTASEYLAAYNAFAPLHGFFPTSYPSAMLFATEAAYLAYNGDHFHSAEFPELTYVALSMRFAQVPALAFLSDAKKQQFNDVTAVIGVGFLVDRAEALRHHDSKALRLTKSQARKYLMALWHVDPATTPIDDFESLGNRIGSCDGWKWLSSGGKVGRSPIAGALQALGALR